MEHTILQLVKSMLTDEHGVSQETYDALCSLRYVYQDTDLGESLRGIMRKVDATDGRYYLPHHL